MKKLTSQSEWISRAHEVLPSGGFGNFDPNIVIANGEGFIDFFIFAIIYLV